MPRRRTDVGILTLFKFGKEVRADIIDMKEGDVKVIHDGKDMMILSKDGNTINVTVIKHTMLGKTKEETYEIYLGGEPNGRKV